MTPGIAVSRPTWKFVAPSRARKTGTNGAAALIVEVDAARIQRRLETRYLDEATTSLDDALRRLDEWRRTGVARSIGLEGNAADVLPELVRRGVTPDVLTDQTSAHDALNGYVPCGMPFAQALTLRQRQPDAYVERSMQSMARHVEAMLTLQSRGAVTFGCFNNPAKLTPRMTSVWAAILRRLPNSRLLLQFAAWDEPGTQQRYRSLFAEHPRVDDVWDNGLCLQTTDATCGAAAAATARTPTAAARAWRSSRKRTRSRARRPPSRGFASWWRDAVALVHGLRRGEPVPVLIHELLSAGDYSKEDRRRHRRLLRAWR